MTGTPGAAAAVFLQRADPRPGYFEKANDSLPLLHEDSFRRQFHEDKHRISPALLALPLRPHPRLLAALARPFEPPVSRQPVCVELANEAVYSELHLSPGMSIIKAILLNIGGRPTTSLIGNGVLLGSAVSMAHSCG